MTPVPEIENKLNYASRHARPPTNVAAWIAFTLAIAAIVALIALCADALAYDDGVVGKRLWNLVGVCSAGAVVMGIAAEWRVRRAGRRNMLATVGLFCGLVLAALSGFFMYRASTGAYGSGYK